MNLLGKFIDYRIRIFSYPVSKDIFIAESNIDSPNLTIIFEKRNNYDYYLNIWKFFNGRIKPVSDELISFGKLR